MNYCKKNISLLRLLSCRIKIMNQFYHNTLKNNIIKACLLIFILAVCFIAYFIGSESMAGSALSKQSRSFDLIYKVTIPDIPTNSGAMDIRIPLPRSDNFQRVSDLEVISRYPYMVTTESDFGNQMLYIKANVKLIDTLFVEFHVQITRNQISNKRENDQFFKSLNTIERRTFLSAAQ